nr:EOG090X0EJA [Lepidurus arcticus]
MSDTAQVSSLPPPPVQFISLYSDENIKRGRAPKPPALIDGSYSMFGNVFHADDAVIRPLESQGIRRLYPNNYDHRRELKKLNHSVLASFLDLVDILIRSPESSRRAEKIEDITLLFIHMHHLVNEFRPHQARETLRVMLELQKRQRLETAERFQRHLEKVLDIVQQAIQNLPDSSELESDNKLLIPTERLEAERRKDSIAENCSGHDKLMCDIIDAL